VPNVTVLCLEFGSSVAGESGKNKTRHCVEVSSISQVSVDKVQRFATASTLKRETLSKLARRRRKPEIQ